MRRDLRLEGANLVVAGLLVAALGTTVPVEPPRRSGPIQDGATSRPSGRARDGKSRP